MDNRTFKKILAKAGFVYLPRRGKGSHTIWKHKTSNVKITCSGKNSQDAKPYQLKILRLAIQQIEQA